MKLTTCQVMTPFSESPQATASQMISTIDNAENTERTSSTSPTDLSNDAMSSVEDTWLKVGSHSQLTTSATYPRLGDANTTWMWGDGDIAVNNTMLGDPGESESQLVLILSIVAACGVLLVLAMLLTIVIICWLRRRTGTEPQLLTFSLSGESDPSPNNRRIRGIINQAYESEFTHFDSFTSSLDRKSPDREIVDNSDTESAHAIETLCENQPNIKPKDTKSSKRKAHNEAVVKKSANSPRALQGRIIQEANVLSFHSENGISECVNPLYGKERNKTYGNIPLESISEDDVENSDFEEAIKGASSDIHPHNDSIVLDNVSSTFPDVDHKCLENVPGINMADSVSNTQSCPNTPLMHSRGISLLKVVSNRDEKATWVSESNITGGDDDRSFRGSDCVNKSPAPVLDDLNGSWRGDLDETWEAKTSF